MGFEPGADGIQVLKGHKAAPVQEEPASGDTFEELPQELAQTLTGQIRLSEIAEGVEEQPEEPKKPAPKKRKKALRS